MLGALIFSVVPLLAYLLWSRAAVRDWRVALVQASLAWAAGAMVLTETLSLFHALRFWPVFAAWLTINGLLVGLVWRHAARWVRPKIAGPVEWIFAGTLAALLALSLIVAFGAPPNTPDVLAYHLPRQLMWLQQGGVQHFVTADERALMMPPFAEVVQAHAMLLAGGDYWANFLQWFAYALGAVVVSLLARELGANRRGQILAALVFATMPMAYLEASSAKNDSPCDCSCSDLPPNESMIFRPPAPLSIASISVATLK